ncbi:hypothetical protein A2716_02400 [candidate division WWE3 bacterium RIFCSPHIGHO2_01_FULL_40_23]|uniref:Uncharacterized protein n=1 Tax=candidate division WWE3 bacterium RIFCSPLOWO2_01_FULL_41_18 TaxID=1802625 RepID=A0A1F4VF14_UNCKA|nr:MAG: hypothetical protein A2716_02400 [candidate division WWE3 bacterium RIFCSPHIGHO2_01_FULL_40_23]OGC55836.1 MAG: hypothetical protein A3A78_02250 [candidate division WWE3 bacterium RIFCSPLOWO2_01_FULL_41_18]
MSKVKVIVTLLITGLGFALILFYLNSSRKPEEPQAEGTYPEKEIAKEPTQQPTQSADYKASFAIYTNNTFRIFTASMYHNLSPDVYIKKDNPNIVHVKEAGITWGDFFDTLPLKLTKDCLTTGTGQTFCTGASGALEFYLNGIKNEELLNQEIKTNDKALITFRGSGDADLQKQLQSIPDPETAL